MSGGALKVGELYWRLSLDDKPFAQGLDDATREGPRRLERGAAPMRRAGEKVGKAAGDGLAGEIDKSSEQSTRNIDGAIRRATAPIVASARGMARRMGGELEKAADSAGRAAGDSIETGVKRGTSGAVEEVRQSKSRMKAAGATAGDSAGSGLAAGIQKAGPAIASVMTTAVTAGAAAAAAAGALAFSTYFEQDVQSDRIAAQLGLDPAKAKVAGKAAAEVYRNAWGDTMAEASDVVVSVLATSSVDDADLARVAGNVLAVATTFAVSADEIASTAQGVLAQGLAGSFEEAVDMIAASMQKVPERLRGPIIEAAREYDVSFAAMGISGEAMFGILTAAAEDGEWQIDKVGDAIKELTIRSTDMSKTSQDAYKAAGLDGQKMAAKILAGGQSAAEGLGEIIAGLQAIPDPVKRANAAIGLFGTPLEDLGVGEIDKFLASLDKGTTGLGDFAGAADRVATTVSDNGTAKLEAFKRRTLGGLADFVEGTLLPALEDFGDWWGDTAWPAIQRFADSVGQRLTPVLKDLAAWWEENGPAITTQLEKLWGKAEDTFAAIGDAAQALFDLLSQIWAIAGPDLLDALHGVWDQVIAVVGGALDVVKGLFDVFAGIFSGDWSKVWDGLREIVKGVWDAIVGIVKGGYEQISGVFDALGSLITKSEAWQSFLDLVTEYRDRIVEVIVNLVAGVQRSLSGLADFITSTWDGIVAFVTSIPDKITSALSGMWGGVFDGLKSAFAAVANWIIGQLNDLISQVNALTSLIPGFGDDLAIPQIPTVEQPQAAKPANSSGGGKGASKPPAAPAQRPSPPPAAAPGATPPSAAPGATAPPASSGGVPTAPVGTWGLPTSPKLSDKFTAKDGSQWLFSGSQWVQIRPPGSISPTAGSGGIRRFHTGGVIPGQRGQEVPIVAQAGETVRTPAQETALGQQLGRMAATGLSDAGPMRGISAAIGQLGQSALGGLNVAGQGGSDPTLAGSSPIDYDRLAGAVAKEFASRPTKINMTQTIQSHRFEAARKGAGQGLREVIAGRQVR